MRIQELPEPVSEQCITLVSGIMKSVAMALAVLA